jgi:hypothetical protein
MSEWFLTVALRGFGVAFRSSGAVCTGAPERGPIRPSAQPPVALGP